MFSQTREGPVLIVNVTLNVQIPTYSNSSVIAHLQEAAALMNEPKLAPRRYRRRLFI